MTDQPPPPDEPPSAGPPPPVDTPPVDTPPAESAPGFLPPGDPAYDRPPPYSNPYGDIPGTPPPGDVPPGHAPPGSGPYDPRWGYGPPGVPYGMPQSPPQETTWAIFSYVGIILIGFLAPLIIYFVKRHTEPFTRYHAAQALNFQLTLLIHALVVAAICVPPAIALDTPAFLALFALPYLELLIGQWVFIILGAVKAGKGQYIRFPTFFCLRMIK
ncbi:DUF4870 domain-containing protein [Actinomadura spongiicola]|uniref:DUF4870 domain-containing protein n=1 Tax=Actinomadura spongiicola TaxID=2303421 RepID=A0A372GKP3_9ACTN|nr:DUF4870 domain-containing protein [Actinomadura spongiicola]RFS85699.1 DUF4870 domain-containing protein [Actinomadura spongiicola]